MTRLTARDREGDEEPDELEDEELEGEEEDEELDDDELEGEEGEEEPEDAARAPQLPPAPVVTEPPRLAFVDPGTAAGAPGPSAPSAPVARTVGAWLPFEDERVGYVLVYRAGQGGSYLSRLVRPFPQEPLEQWLARMYGPGRYRLLERGNPPTREYIGSLTVTAADIAGLTTTPVANGNGNGHAPAPAPAPAAYGGPMDYRLALVTTGLPLLAGVLGEFAKAMAARPQRSELETILAAAKLLQTPNEERSALFREGIKLAREMEPPRSEGGPEQLFNVRDILSGVGEILKAWRESRPAAPPAAVAPGAAPPAAAASPAGALQAEPGETPQGFVERALIMEIRRAVGSADTPDTFVVLVGSWLPATVISWLETAPEDEILEQLPAQFPAHADYLKEPEVQRFLRSALAMLREDAAATDTGEGALVREPAAAGV